MLQAQPPPAEAAKKLDTDLQSTVLSSSSGVRRVSVTVDQSILVAMNKPTSRVQAIAPQVAFVQSVSPKQILISGVSFGTTQVIVWSGDEEYDIFEVEVTLDLDSLKKALNQIEPSANVQVVTVRGNLLLTGTVGSGDTIRRMQEVAVLFLPEGGQIRNQLRTSDEALNQALKAVDPLSDVTAQTLGGRVILTGSASGPQAVQRIIDVAGLYAPASAGATGAAGPQGSAGGLAEEGNRIANHMSVRGEQQVLLRVTVAEVSRAATRELGINGFLAGENFRDAFAVSQIAGIAPQSIGVPAAAVATENMPFVVGDQGIPIPLNTTLSLGFPRAQMQLFLQAMADNTLLRTLAEPNLVAISGETAGFLAGGEFPVPVPQGVDQITIEYKQFGVALQFTPVVLDGEMIRLHIAPEVSEIDFASGVQLQGFSVPGIRVRRAETTVEVGAGQTLAIAGLLGEESRGAATRLPGIGDIPVLGALFRSVRYQNNQTELVILVTPEVVSPMNPDQVGPRPGDDHTPPSDLELYTLGLLESPDDDDDHDDDDDFPDRRVGQYRTEPDQLSIHGPWGHSGVMENM